MSIHDWHENDRPREKLLKFGAASLTDAELLAIFLRTGVKGKSAVELAEDLLAHFGSLHELLNANQATFCEAKGLGSAKFTQLKAVLEMSHRHFKSGLQQMDAFNAPELVAQFLDHHIGHHHRERFGVLFLNQQHQLIEYQTLFEGTINQASVHPREIAKSALELNCAAVILAHNHPSGDPKPSDADIHLTKEIQSALNLFEIRTLDHIILGDTGRWNSLAQLGKMP